ncbi:MAG TPA: histidine ammonia-lyase [Thermoanaerobaculia bacterium]
MTDSVTLDGKSLTIDDLVRVARNPAVRVRRAPETTSRIEATAKKVADLVQRYRDAPEGTGPREYGVTTGFGEFKDKPIETDQLYDLQRNLLLSHAVGVGENTDRSDLSNYYSAEIVRGALLIRLNTFLLGHSGVRLLLVEVVQAMLNCGVIPLIPLRGSVGASGDLCPLSHLFATLLGEGRFYRVQDPNRKLHDASEMLQVLQEEVPTLPAHGFRLEPKEGLALNNGANFSAAMLALGVHDARILADTADVAVSMTLEAMGGCRRAFAKRVHDVRPHPGQIKSAERIRLLTDGSSLLESAAAVQDPYSIRCAPQVHGASRGAVEYAATVAECEINSATDNPLFFEEEPSDKLDRQSYSAGNFHGQPLALAADFLTIALAELANISERRTQTLLDGHHNRNLPENLIPCPGLNSGFMIAQYTAASLVSENKVLSHPASVDSIPTSANSEDHVSMSTHAARKMRTVLGNAQSVLAIELMVAAQALEWRVAMKVPARRLASEEKTPYRPEKLADLNEQSKRFTAEAGGDDKPEIIAEGLAPAIRPLYRTIRTHAKPMLGDRALDEDIRAVRASIERGELRGPTT